ncbi:helix-hairpin-helix domain-containing protein [Alteribacillus sp. JSM 102045]|uniref:helix-hairpin-helix domain-containing protein n=1 Tax=Alteribacillus sp. JSM 102045 TaxID=1562101 RepID=UPI0035C0E11D
MKRPKLPLTESERKALRKKRINLTNLHTCRTDEIAFVLGCAMERAEILKALALFQQLPSIGVKGAEQVVFVLGILSLGDMAKKSGADWLDELEQKLGVWTDPCVEDQLRCMVHHARYSDSSKQWFEFTEERKIYRAKYGYPANRPKKAWYE